MSEEKNLGGAPVKPIDYPKLIELCKIMCTGEECASVLGMSYESLNNKLHAEEHGGFLEFLKRHSGEAKASVRRTQFKLAVEEQNPTMLIWLGKQYLGQKDKNELEHAGGIGVDNAWTVNVVPPTPKADDAES
jgi:hypothetical protein